MPNKPPKTSRSFSAFSSASEEARLYPDETSSRGATNAEPGRGGANATPNEVTEVERRVLAHERILQALIGHLADDDPEILVQLKARFGSGHDLGQHEQNYVSTDDYCDHFIRSIELEVERRKRRDTGGRG
ncbi:hypothetical protein KRR38_12225 [Novosphingobium sp. G106]|uniref:hypothetical protein n=1 Tax=Novosphingobium sp. G106 TaxID=2849500 RepID=UPI001C2CE477|nr:hypothetical protein [Novosphingobium sp. G106]MBV1688420.1 hypothetical protein [Novosphingobium sp. G106]